VNPAERRSITFTLGSVMLVMLLAALDQTIVGTAMPRIVADLQGFERYAWVTTSYMVASTTIVPIVGKLSDMFGRRMFYLAGLMIFLAGSALCGAASDMTTLILFRLVQGVGAGIVMAIAFIVIGDLFPPAERGRIQGLFAAVFGMAALIGPPLGGYLADHTSWRYCFYVNLPLGAIALLVVWRFFPDLGRSERRGPIDGWGAATLIGTIVPLLLALSLLGDRHPDRSPWIGPLLILGILSCIAFINAERRASEPLIPGSLFRTRSIAFSIVASFLLSVGMFGVILFVPLYVQVVLGGSASDSGSVLLPMMLGMIVASGGSGLLITRTGRYRAFALGGLATMAVGLIALSRLGADARLESVGAVLGLVGLGLGGVMPVFTIVVQNAAEPRLLGASTAAAQFFRQIGGTFGAAILGAYVTARSNDDVTQRMESLRPTLLSTLPADDPLTAPIADPGVLLDRVAQGTIGLPDPVIAALRSSVGEALSVAFLAGAIAVIAALVATILIPEVPLRRVRHPIVAAETAGGAAR